MSIIITLLAFGLMISIHELGHFIAAKKFGVLVHEFSIGMGPKIVSRKKGETAYSIRLLPIGGYVKLEGENELETTVDESNPRAFINLHPLKRIIVLSAGAIMNLILGLIIFIVINMNSGVVPNKVYDVSENYSLQETIFKKGDEILKLNNSTMHTYRDISFYMSRYDSDKIDITLKRDGDILKFNDIKLQKTESGYILGVVFNQEKASFVKSAEYAFYDTAFTVKAVVLSLKDIITGDVPMNAMSGPVEIVSVVDDVTSAHTVYPSWLIILELIAMITVNLGVFNLLPFPALDGGSIVFALYELITKKKVKNQIIGYASVIGFALLMLLAVFVTAGDIKDLITN